MSEDSFRLPWFRLPRAGKPAAGAKVALETAKGAVVPLSETLDSDLDAESVALAGLVTQAGDAANFLKALGHDGRLTILCHLSTGAKSVTELENLLSARQAVVSQQLARLRLEGLVSARREGQAIFYSILDPKVMEMLALLGHLFRAQDSASR